MKPVIASFLQLFLLIFSAGFTLDLQSQHFRSSMARPQAMLLDESFDFEPSPKWNTSSGQAPVLSNFDGKLMIAAMPDAEVEYWVEMPVGPQDDYELDLSMTLRNSGAILHNSYGFIFGVTPQGTRLAFTFGSEGQYSIQELGARGDAFVWQYDHARELVSYRFQQFIVRKIGNHVSFSVDGQPIYEWTYEGISGERVGLLVGKGAEIMVDHLRLVRLSSGPALPDQPATDISLLDPAIQWENGFAHHLASHPLQTIRGSLSPQGSWTAMWMNDEFVKVQENGSFIVQMTLLEGHNSFTFKVLLSNGTLLKRQLSVQFQQPFSMAKGLVEVAGEPIYSQTPDLSAITGTGRNFLVLIGMNQYSYWNDLHNAVKDCEDIAKTLVDHYQFEPNYVIRLYNEEATRTGILETMEWLQDELLPEDNLLIYYAGHGHFDEQDKLGYWVPVDGRMDKVVDYIPNSTIHDYLATIDCQHTLLVADACFSGSLLSSMRGRYDVNERSRWVFASGGEYERVFDGAPGENSPFAQEMISYLMSHRENTFIASDMIDHVAAQVTERVKQHPVASPLMNAGDAGGVFPFLPKQQD